MAAWQGFSQDDFNEVQEEDAVIDLAAPVNTSGKSNDGKRVVGKLSKRQQHPRHGRIVTNQATDSTDKTSTPLHPDQRLSVPKTKLQNHEPTNDQCIAVRSEKQSAAGNEGCDKKDENVIQTDLEDKGGPEEICEKNTIRRQLSTLEEFQQQQKLMEEQNKHRRALLTKAIASRKKKTVEEQIKLSKIQKELEHLDGVVSSGIYVLRNKIEDASREFLEAQKRHERAEQEYVRAKLNLRQKTDVKEMLTEHLYTIIQENEKRKSKKLLELMESLEDAAGSLPPDNYIHVQDNKAGDQIDSSAMPSEIDKTVESRRKSSNCESIDNNKADDSHESVHIVTDKT